jgi:hypothetical protein
MDYDSSRTQSTPVLLTNEMEDVTDKTNDSMHNISYHHNGSIKFKRKLTK